MSKKIFQEVWYRFNENRWTELVAFYDYGTLEVQQNGIKFIGKKGTVDILDIHLISYGRQGTDFANNWVKIIYGKDETAYFADGTYQGWGGIFGGTKKILKAVQALKK